VNHLIAELQLLSLLLAAPGKDALAALELFTVDHPWLAEAVTELRGLALERWQAEYTRLFVNGYPRTDCPPFESVYRHGCMGGEVVGELGELYREIGLYAEGAPADFLGTQLECLAYLLEQESGVLGRLWDGHLRGWLPRFVRDLRGAAHLRLYRQLAERLDRLLETGLEVAA